MISCFGATPQNAVPLMVNTNGWLLAPIQWWTNGILAGSNIVITYTRTNVTISSTGGGGGAASLLLEDGGKLLLE